MIGSSGCLDLCLFQKALWLLEISSVRQRPFSGQFNSEFVFMKVLIMKRAICHTNAVTPVIFWLRCSQMDNGSALASGKQSFLLERAQLPGKHLKPQEDNELPRRSCIIFLVAFCSEYSRVVEVWVFPKGEKRPVHWQRLQEWMHMQKQPQGNLGSSGQSFFSLVAASFLLTVGLGI